MKSTVLTYLLYASIYDMIHYMAHYCVLIFKLWAIDCILNYHEVVELQFMRDLHPVLPDTLFL